MAGSKARPPPTEQETLSSVNAACASGGQPMRYTYDNWRSVSLLNGRVVRLKLKVRRCYDVQCALSPALSTGGRGPFGTAGARVRLGGDRVGGVLHYRQH